MKIVTMPWLFLLLVATCGAEQAALPINSPGDTPEVQENQDIQKKQSIQETQQEATPIVIDRALVLALVKTSEKLAEVAVAHPEFADYMQQFSTANSDELTPKLSNTRFYPDIEAVLKDSKFASLSEMLTVSKRIMAMLFYMEYGQEAAEKNIESMLSLLKANYEGMKPNQTNEASLAKLESDYQYQKLKYEGLRAALKLLTKQDKAFAIENHQWLKQSFSN